MLTNVQSTEICMAVAEELCKSAAQFVAHAGETATLKSVYIRIVCVWDAGEVRLERDCVGYVKDHGPLLQSMLRSRTCSSAPSVPCWLTLHRAGGYILGHALFAFVANDGAPHRPSIVREDGPGTPTLSWGIPSDRSRISDTPPRAPSVPPDGEGPSRTPGPPSGPPRQIQPSAPSPVMPHQGHGRRRSQCTTPNRAELWEKAASSIGERRARQIAH